MRSEQAVPVKRLERLSRMSDFEVDRNQHDPRGWTVVNRDGQRIGEVEDLIVDTERMVATYLDVELDTKHFDFFDHDPHVFIPVDRAFAEDKRVRVDGITREWVAELSAARLRHQEEFWDRWWHRPAAPEQREPTTRIRRRVETADVQKAIEDVRPGEAVRIPVIREEIKEEIVVERRPVASDERR